jgi:hypothetical protein
MAKVQQVIGFTALEIVELRRLIMIADDIAEFQANTDKDILTSLSKKLGGDMTMDEVREMLDDG